MKSIAYRLVTGFVFISFSFISAAQSGNWSGPYAGVQLGYGEANYDGVFDSNDSPNEIAFADNLDLSGLVGGIHIGYSLQQGQWVFGIEGDANWMDWDDTVFDANPTSDDGLRGDINFLATLRGLIGLAGDRHLIYATAGIAYIDADYQAIESPTEISSKVDLESVGFVIGGGAQYAITDHLILRIEGLYYSFDERENTANLLADSDPNDFVELEDVYTILTGLSYKF